MMSSLADWAPFKIPLTVTWDKMEEFEAFLPQKVLNLWHLSPRVESSNYDCSPTRMLLGRVGAPNGRDFGQISKLTPIFK